MRYAYNTCIRKSLDMLDLTMLAELLLYNHIVRYVSNSNMLGMLAIQLANANFPRLQICNKYSLMEHI